ncbi:SIS domain-containing protein [Chitinilyticum litopenaei]|uniref:SIS domain-containing protein n=1 Tax=Chitinilyticum litopenaei TaxID=1121276 RepID=UPI000400E995|nr:SIS domain-containing protein [Chitinilyticum litopenaei]
MTELIAYLAPQNVLPALAESLQGLTGNASHLALVAAEQSQWQVRHVVLAAPAQKLVFPFASRWLIATLAGQDTTAPFIHEQTLVVASSGQCDNHAALARLAGLPAQCSLASLLAALLQAQQQRGLSLSQAMQRVNPLLQGRLAYICHTRQQPQHAFASSLGEPLFVGLESGLRQLCCSNERLIRQRTTQYHALAHNEVVRFGLDAPLLFGADGQAQSLPMTPTRLSGTPHHMLEEILAQPDALAGQVSDFLGGQLIPADLERQLAGIRQITLVASGSSHHAALTGSYWLEALAGLRVQIALASEYRERPVLSETGELVLAISQSGETADTLLALQHARQRGDALTVALCNAPGSSLAALAHFTLLTHSGEEHSVTATKSFTAQLLLLYQLALAMARARGKIDAEAWEAAQGEMQQLPITVRAVLAHDRELRRWASALHSQANVFMLGSHAVYPIAQEGAFKLQEVAYQHAVAYATGELKHGPVTLLGDTLPIVLCLPWNTQAERTLLGLQEIRAGRGELYILSDGILASTDRQHVIHMPGGLSALTPIIYAVALQLLAYHCAVLRGNAIDAPRHLAKAQALG